MSKKHNFPHVQQPKQQTQEIITQSQSFSSPYPLPIQVECFERLAPGSTKAILETARESIKYHERIQEEGVRATIAHDLHMLNTVRWTIAIGAVGTFTLAILNKDAASYVLLFSYLASLVGAFVYTRKKKQA